jgi:hypothetical protein
MLKNPVLAFNMNNKEKSLYDRIRKLVIVKPGGENWVSGTYSPVNYRITTNKEHNASVPTMSIPTYFDMVARPI